MIKINKAKLVPKLILAILIITIITGFASTFATAKKRNQSFTKLDFEAKEVLEIWDVQKNWEMGNRLFMKAYKKALLMDGKIDDIEFTGYDELDLIVILDPVTGKYISIGTVTMYIEWNGLSGSFFGFVIGWGTIMVSADGAYALQGAGDFEGMKLYGKVWAIDAYYGINGLSGTILNPN
ncbi:MAG: hypothetical protein ACFE9M_05295 [Promethearchaeota archaeon]